MYVLSRKTKCIALRHPLIAEQGGNGVNVGGGGGSIHRRW